MERNSQHDLRQLLLKGNSRSYTDFVSDILSRCDDLWPEIWDIFLSMDEPVARRAAWVIDTATEKQPELVVPYLDELVNMLGKFNHDGLKRHALRIISRNEFPENTESALINICFDWLLSITESVAVKMYCMLILYRISKSEPDILPELYDTIDFQMADGTPGFKSMGAKMLHDIDHDILMRKLNKKGTDF